MRAVVRAPALPRLWVTGLLVGLVGSAVLGWIPGTWETVGILAICFVAELMDSSLGMGYGTTLTPVLLALGYAPLQLVPTVLVSELLSGFAASFFHHRVGNVDLSRGSPHRRTAALLAGCSVLGALVGVNLAVELPRPVLKAGIGVIVLAAGVWIVVRVRRPPRYSTSGILGLGVLASFNKAVSGGGYGPLLTSGQILTGTEGRAAIGITSLAEAFTCLVATLLFLIRGQAIDVPLLLCVCGGALLSVPFSAHLVRRTQEVVIRYLVAGATILLGLFTLLQLDLG